MPEESTSRVEWGRKGRGRRRRKEVQCASVIMTYGKLPRGRYKTNDPLGMGVIISHVCHLWGKRDLFGLFQIQTVTSTVSHCREGNLPERNERWISGDGPEDFLSFLPLSFSFRSRLFPGDFWRAFANILQSGSVISRFPGVLMVLIYITGSPCSIARLLPQSLNSALTICCNTDAPN